MWKWAWLLWWFSRQPWGNRDLLVHLLYLLALTPVHSFDTWAQEPLGTHSKHRDSPYPLAKIHSSCEGQSTTSIFKQRIPRSWVAHVSLGTRRLPSQLGVALEPGFGHSQAIRAASSGQDSGASRLESKEVLLSQFRVSTSIWRFVLNLPTAKATSSPSKTRNLAILTR